MVLHDLFFYAITFFVSLLVLVLVLFRTNFGRRRYKLPPSPISLPIIGHLHLIGTFPYKSFQKLSSRYGPLFHLRLGSVPCIVASSPEIVKELLLNNEKSFLTHPVTIAIHNISYGSSGFAFGPYDPIQKYMKKLSMSHLLTGNALVQLQPIREDEIQRFVRFLIDMSNAGRIVNLSEEFMKLSNNIVTRMMLSMRYSGKKDQAVEILKLTREVTKIYGESNLSDIFGFLRVFDFQGFLKRSNDIQRRYHALLEKIMAEREKIREMKKEKTTHDSDGVGDFLDILLDALADEKSEIKITRDNIMASVLDLITASSDTSASAVEWALAELINHPNIFKKAREEINSVVGKTRLVEESDLPNLPYLQAIFKEALRLHPPVPLLIRESTQDCKVGGYDIPAKTRLFVNLWSMSRDPKIWKDPLEFKPERFMIISKLSIDQGEYLPFGTGRRGCPGKLLAQLEVTTILAAMIQCFDWKVVGNDSMVDMTERFGLTVPKAHPLMLVPVTFFDPFNFN
ncbi:Cytochrome P450 [Macleaya cordata]|uniref:Cytochrome P450 n=1 Tax=Macleaya cordata TaxID=56857 RepID=A0A200Q376_MACCD|nr:Cytochrome P450 [Macleaya cordata]